MCIVTEVSFIKLKHLRRNITLVEIVFIFHDLLHYKLVRKDEPVCVAVN